MRAALLPFDVIFMDVNMPEMSGFDATRGIRRMTAREPRLTWPVIIGITGDVSASTAEECLASGMNAVLTKPLNTQKLFLEVTRWLGLRQDSTVSGEE